MMLPKCAILPVAECINFDAWWKMLDTELKEMLSTLVLHINFYQIDIYKTTLSATTLPATELFSTTEQSEYGVYSFAVENNKIYVGDATDYSSNGKVYVYSFDGDLLADKTVGVIPAGFYFNQSAKPQNKIIVYFFNKKKPRL